MILAQELPKNNCPGTKLKSQKRSPVKVLEGLTVFATLLYAQGRSGLVSGLYGLGRLALDGIARVF